MFALSTLIVFAILIHGRIMTRDKRLRRAGIALFGAAVMLLNWFAISFVVTGRHRDA